MFLFILLNLLLLLLLLLLLPLDALLTLSLRWRNAWNAVYVAGAWRLVQPNWAAMQVQTKVRGRIRKDHFEISLNGVKC